MKTETVINEDGAETKMVPADVAQGLYEALVGAREELEAWRQSFPSNADSEDVAQQIDEALAAADGEEER